MAIGFNGCLEGVFDSLCSFKTSETGCCSHHGVPLHCSESRKACGCKGVWSSEWIDYFFEVQGSCGLRVFGDGHRDQAGKDSPEGNQRQSARRWEGNCSFATCFWQDHRAGCQLGVHREVRLWLQQGLGGLQRSFWNILSSLDHFYNWSFKDAVEQLEEIHLRLHFHDVPCVHPWYCEGLVWGFSVSLHWKAAVCCEACLHCGEGQGVLAVSIHFKGCHFSMGHGWGPHGVDHGLGQYDGIVQPEVAGSLWGSAGL